MEIGVSVPNIGPMASRQTIFAVAERAEALGLDSLWFGDHLAFPKSPQKPYPYSRGAPRYLPAQSRILEVLTVMAAVAARTQRVRIGTSVLILPYRHPLLTAKMIATIDELSGGRVILGIGVGWLPEEFEAVGASLKDRGAVSDEQIEYFRQVWSHDSPRYEGKHYRIADMPCLPRPSRRIPIWIGGQTKAAMRRAARLGDGLHMIDCTAAELESYVKEFQQVCKDASRPFGEVALSIRSSLRLTDAPATDEQRRTPITGTPQQVVDTLEAFRRLGVEHVALGPSPRQGDLKDYLRIMEIIGKEIRPALV